MTDTPKQTKERRTVEQVEWPLLAMTVEETAAALRVHPRTILDLLRDGRFPGRKVGNGWRINPDAVKKWLSVFENVAPFAEWVEVEEKQEDKTILRRVYKYTNERCIDGITILEPSPDFPKVREEMEQAKLQGASKEEG